jgi:hypothetical protein
MYVVLFLISSFLLGLGYCFGLAEHFSTEDINSNLIALSTNFHLELSKLAIEVRKIRLWILQLIIYRRFSWNIYHLVQTDEDKKVTYLKESIYRVISRFIIGLMELIHTGLLILYIRYLPTSILNYHVAKYLSLLPDFNGNPFIWFPIFFCCYPITLKYGMQYLKTGKVQLFV